MSDAYNKAIKYLTDKYGTVSELTCKAYEKLRKTSNKKEYNEVKQSFTDIDYNKVYYISNIPKENKWDIELALLVEQYCYGSIAIKPELEQKIFGIL